MTETTINNESNKISFDNFDSSKKKIRITSPISLLACKFMGIELNDLAFLTFDEYLQKNPECQVLDDTAKMERYEHHNARRKKLLISLKKVRDDIIKEKNEDNNNNGNINNITNYYNWYCSKSRNNSFNNLNRTFHINKNNNLRKSTSMVSMNNIIEKNKSFIIKNNQEKLNQIKKRQEINIKMRIDFQLMKEQMRIKNLEKMKIKNENEKMMKIKRHEELMKKKLIDEKKEIKQKLRMENLRKKMEEKIQESINKENIKRLNEQKKKEEEEKKRRIKFETQEKKGKIKRDKVIENNIT